MNEIALQNRATEIIKPLVPSDAEERVRRSFTQWNNIVRDHIRTETGLKLAAGGNRSSIPVRVVKGFPTLLAQLINQYRDPVMWRLIIGQPKLGGLIEGLDFLLQNWEQFEQWPSLPEPARNGQPVLDRALKIATSLQQVALADNVLQKIKDIHEDILGVYRFATGQGTNVELYWLPIAMVAAMIDVAIEDLTVVVLIHELAHGYTHIGCDIDGASWDDAGFCYSDLGVLEGLAQFYTEVISERLAARAPSIFTAYNALLKLQSGPYLAHREWMKVDKRQIRETIRFTLIAARGHGIVDYGHWQRLMADTSKNLSRGNGRRDPLFDE